MVKELPKNQLKPAAQPVSKFLSFRSQQPGVPTQPQMAPQVKGVNIIQRGNVQNVQGYNSFTEWANSMKQVSGAISSGAQVYKSVQETQGKNQVDKAIYNLKKQQLESGQEWTETQKKVAKDNLEAALMMDQVNPFRRVAMEKRLSELAGLEVNSEMTRQYNAVAKDIIGLDPGDQRVNAIKAQVVNELSNKYLLNESRAGFVDHFLPAVNESWLKISDKHLKANVKYFKYKQNAQTQAKLFTTAQTYLEANPGDYTNLPSLLGDILNQEAIQLGLPLEPTEFKKDVIVGLVGKVRGSDIGNKEQIISQLAKIVIGQKKNNKGETETTYAGDWFGTEMLLEDVKVSKAKYELNKKDFEINKQAAMDKHEDAITGTVKGSPEYDEAVAAFMADSDGLSQTEKKLVLKEIDARDTAIALFDFKVSRIDDVYGELESTLAINYDPAEARTRMQSLFAGGKAEGYGKQELAELYRKTMKDVSDLSKRKQQELTKGTNATEVRTAVKRVTEAKVGSLYPEQTGALNRGIKKDNPELKLDRRAYKANYETIKAQAYGVIQDEFYRMLQSAFRDAQGKEGRTELLPEEQSAIIANTEKDFITRFDEITKDRLPEIPIIKNTNYKPPEGGNTENTSDTNISSKPKYKTFSRSSTVHPKFIDNDAWKVAPIYDEADTKKMIEQVIKSKSLKGLPAAFINTAKRAMPNGNAVEFLFEHAEIHHPEIEIDPIQKKLTLQKMNGMTGLQSSIRKASPLGGPLSYSTNYMTALLTGEAPILRSS